MASVFSMSPRLRDFVESELLTSPHSMDRQIATTVLVDIKDERAIKALRQSYEKLSSMNLSSNDLEFGKSGLLHRIADNGAGSAWSFIESVTQSDSSIKAVTTGLFLLTKHSEDFRQDNSRIRKVFAGRTRDQILNLLGSLTADIVLYKFTKPMAQELGFITAQYAGYREADIFAKLFEQMFPALKVDFHSPSVKSCHALFAG